MQHPRSKSVLITSTVLHFKWISLSNEYIELYFFRLLFMRIYMRIILVFFSSIFFHFLILIIFLSLLQVSHFAYIIRRRRKIFFFSLLGKCFIVVILVFAVVEMVIFGERKENNLLNFIPHSTCTIVPVECNDCGIVFVYFGFKIGTWNK